MSLLRRLFRRSFDHRPDFLFDSRSVFLWHGGLIKAIPKCTVQTVKATMSVSDKFSGRINIHFVVRVLLLCNGWFSLQSLLYVCKVLYMSNIIPFLSNCSSRENFDMLLKNYFYPGQCSFGGFILMTHVLMKYLHNIQAHRILFVKLSFRDSFINSSEIILPPLTRFSSPVSHQRRPDHHVQSHLPHSGNLTVRIYIIQSLIRYVYLFMRRLRQRENRSRKIRNERH